MDEIRVITWTVSDDGLELLPEAPQFGGVQGEDNATLVRFAIGEGCPIAKSDYHLYIEVVDATGAWDRTDRLYIEGGYVTHTVPLAWTQHGGTTTLRLQAEKDGQIIYSLSGMLRFDNRAGAVKGVISVFRTLVQKALDELRAARQEFRDSIDDHLDEYSKNPVENGVVAGEIHLLQDESADHWRRIQNLLERMGNFERYEEEFPLIRDIAAEMIPDLEKRIQHIEDTVPNVDNNLDTESENAVKNSVVSKKIMSIDLAISYLDELMQELNPEVKDARRDQFGVVHSSLGEAIRQQVLALGTDIGNLEEIVKNLPQGGGGGSVIVDNKLDATSKNPVENQVITGIIDDLSNRISGALTRIQELVDAAITVDDQMSYESENPVQNKVIMATMAGIGGLASQAQASAEAAHERIDGVGQSLSDTASVANTAKNTADNAQSAANNALNKAKTAEEKAEALSDRTDAVEERVDDTVALVNDFNGDLSELTNKANGLTKSVQNIENKIIPEHEDRISELENADVVRSVNGQTGAVNLTASDVGARPNTWMPSHTDVGADKAGTANTMVADHNTKTDAHNDIRLLITALTTRLDALANSDDTTLDKMAEVVAYIKANRDLIDQITTGKVSVADIVNNLTTNVSNKPLSAAQGVALKALIDELAAAANSIASIAKTATNGLVDTYTITYTNGTKSTYTVTNGADGATGERGMGMLYITTAPSSYTTATGGFTPVYRIALSTVLSQSKASRVLVGDTLVYSYYLYPVGYVDASYVYLDTRKSLRGANGTSVTVSGVSESTESGGENVVTFSDGKTLAVKNGRDGENGTTPAKGTDYFTAEDKAEMVAAVKAALTTETWTFTLEDGSTVTKKVVLA